MNSRMGIIGLMVTLLCLPLFAQQTTRPSGGGMAERFKQLDRNGDGKVSAEEYRSPQFKQMDKNGDGFVTLEEATRFLRDRRAAESPATQPGAPAEAPAGGELKVVDAVFELCVRDVEACVKFYRDGIGMREVEPAGTNKDALLEWAGSYLRLRRVPGEKPAPATGNPMKQMLSANGFRWFSLWFNDPAAIGERLVKAGYPSPMKGGSVSMTP